MWKCRFCVKQLLVEAIFCMYIYNKKQIALVLHLGVMQAD